MVIVFCLHEWAGQDCWFDSRWCNVFFDRKHVPVQSCDTNGSATHWAENETCHHDLCPDHWWSPLTTANACTAIVASFLSHRLVPFLSGAPGAGPTRSLTSLPFSLPLLCTSHCLYSVHTAPTKTPVGTDMYIDSLRHCRGQATNEQLEGFVFCSEVFHVRISSFLLSPLFPFCSVYPPLGSTSFLSPPPYVQR